MITNMHDYLEATDDSPVCERCAGDGWIETCRADGEDCRRQTCPECLSWEPEDGREAGEDDGVEYSDPREPEGW